MRVQMSANTSTSPLPATNPAPPTPVPTSPPQAAHLLAMHQRHCKGAVQHFLEVACGPARHATVIAKATAGAAATGVDLSPAMLAFARQQAEAAGVADRMSWVEADMTSGEHWWVGKRWCLASWAVHVPDIVCPVRCMLPAAPWIECCPAAPPPPLPPGRRGLGAAGSAACRSGGGPAGQPGALPGQQRCAALLCRAQVGGWAGDWMGGWAAGVPPAHSLPANQCLGDYRPVHHPLPHSTTPLTAPPARHPTPAAAPQCAPAGCWC